jgi:hypothetical protein
MEHVVQLGYLFGQTIHGHSVGMVTHHDDYCIYFKHLISQASLMTIRRCQFGPWERLAFEGKCHEPSGKLRSVAWRRSESCPVAPLRMAWDNIT